MKPNARTGALDARDPHLEKALRLIDYLLKLASLRQKVTRDVSEYEKVLWFSEIPNEPGCFTRAWDSNSSEDSDADEWLEIRNRREPDLPPVPDECVEWIDHRSLQDKSQQPGLRPMITREVPNPEWQEGSDQPKTVTKVERLTDCPDVQQIWDRYVREKWSPWTKEHDAWEKLHAVYSALFAVHQEQVRLGEEYELVIGVGLLTWQTPTMQRVRRHLLVADAALEFDAHRATFTVRAHPDGAKLRPELDMLDIQHQPSGAEEAARQGLTDAQDDPWQKDCVAPVLTALVHALDSRGTYKDALKATPGPDTRQPLVEYAPALILRKRSTKGLMDALVQIRKQIADGTALPTQFADLAEIRSAGPDDAEQASNDGLSVFDGEVYFPKPSNEEQRRIVDKLRTGNGVLVQGPPGTGKSHTIANLICHLLANGQRTLITAKTPRALQVLERLLPPQLQPLCISLLGQGADERRALESSVSGILRMNEDWDVSRAQTDQKELEERLHSLRQEHSQIVRRLREIRESETHTQSVADGAYRGTAARIAEAVHRDHAKYGWFTDTVAADHKCDLSAKTLATLLRALRYFTPEKRRELALTWPSHQSLPTPQRFAELVQAEVTAVELEAQAAQGVDESLAATMANADPQAIETLRDSFSRFQHTYRTLLAKPYAWVPEAVRDVIADNSLVWRNLLESTTAAIAAVEHLASKADQTSIVLPECVDAASLYDDVRKLQLHLDAGGRLGWGPFRPKAVRDRLRLPRQARLRGRPCRTAEDLRLLADILCVWVECDKAWRLWKGRAERVEGAYQIQVAELKSLQATLVATLSLEKLIIDCRSAIARIPGISEPIWANDTDVENILNACRLALARTRRRDAAESLQHTELVVLQASNASEMHPVMRDLLTAIRNRDVANFSQCTHSIEALEKSRDKLRQLDQYLSHLRRRLPRLTKSLVENAQDPCWEVRINGFLDAWRWAQARNWIEHYIRPEDVPELMARLKQIDDEMQQVLASLAAIRAWSFCFSRLTDEHRRHMEGWQQAMRRLGKGTGKYAPRHRREAQTHLSHCREAVPAWVMPLHRVWDTVRQEPGMFDVIIVDEASQCGFEGLPPFYMGKKILIVGDDKQISPESGFMEKNAIFQLMEEFLHDFDHKDSFHSDASLFDQGKLRFGTSRITLREHFRCMPEIIRFSNDLCYSDTPLIPLRQYGTNRLPPLERVFVRGGYREGSNNRVINRPEAEAIAKRISEMCRDQRYDGKTIGVVVLQGQAQAALIQDYLLDRLGAEEIEQRRLLCGTPYSFQGDERDVMLLSLVAATNERIGTLTKAADERRFNVAASRARDQMILFHSVSSEDLAAADLRRRLLDFFEQTGPHTIAGIDRTELEVRAAQDNRGIVSPPRPFESWFEVDTALELLRAGYSVVPQFEVAGKRMDLVIEGGQARLAVECDGDQWHGPDRYEDDMQRQRQLERCGWDFFRVRESAFYANKKRALEGLWPRLEARGIFPNSTGAL